MPQIPTHVKAKGCGQLVNRTLNFRKLANLKSDGQAKSSLFSYFCKNVPKVWLLDIHVQHLEWLQSESTTQVTHRIHNLLSLRVLDVFFSPTLGDLLWAPSTKLTAKGNQYISWWEMSARFQVSRVSPRVFGVQYPDPILVFFWRTRFFYFRHQKMLRKFEKKNTNLSHLRRGFVSGPGWLFSCSFQDWHQLRWHRSLRSRSPSTSKGAGLHAHSSRLEWQHMNHLGQGYTATPPRWLALWVLPLTNLTGYFQNPSKPSVVRLFTKACSQCCLVSWRGINVSTFCHS